MAPSDVLPMSHAKYNDQLFRSALFSDCTIKCQSRMWHLHRAILSPRCEFFWKCFDGPFEESSAIITMHDDDPDTLERMLRWIYTLEWPELKQAVDPWTSDLVLYILADKYGLSALMDQARYVLVGRALSCSNTLRNSNNENFIKHLDDFIEMLEWLFNDPPEREDVRDLQIDILRLTAPMIAKHMRTQPRLQELLRTIPDFGLHLVEALADVDSAQPRKSSIHTLSTPILSESLHGSAGSCQGLSPQKMHIPLNEDSEDEFD